MTITPLSGEEAQLWVRWKMAGEMVMDLVARDIAQATGISGSEYGILLRLVDRGHGWMRQQDLAASMGWDKSRMSHQVTRMEARKLVKRKAVGAKGIDVEVTAAGRKMLEKARPAHAESVRKHMLSHVPKASRKVFLDVVTRIHEAAEGPDEDD